MSDALPKRVRITEVGPRDGLQNEHTHIDTTIKAAFIRALIEAGHTDIEVTSFVRPDRVPQLADAEALFQALGPAPEGVTYSALVPNMTGLERAREAGVRKIAVFTAASESFNQRNINATVAESIEHFRPVTNEARAEGLAVRGYVSTAVCCPYEGRIEPDAVLDVVKRLQELGCDEISVGDTIGAASPADIARLLDVLVPNITLDTLVLHLHDTRGMAVANATEALRHGVQAFDASAGGLGGCPFAPGSAGNLATEDLIFLLDGLGIEHGLDFEAQRRASATIGPHLDHSLASRVYHAPPLPGD